MIKLLKLISTLDAPEEQITYHAKVYKDIVEITWTAQDTYHSTLCSRDHFDSMLSNGIYKELELVWLIEK